MFCQRISQLHKIATYVPNMWNTYVLTICPYPNNQLDLFYSDNLSLQCTAPSMWITNCTDPNTWLQSPTREGCWLQSSSVHHTMKIEKLIRHKTLRCKTQKLLYKKDELGQILSPVTICLNKTLLNTCTTCVIVDGL